MMRRLLQHEAQKQVEDFEAKYGANDMSRSWRKWCNSHEYRRREWLWRQNLAAANEEIYTKKIILI